MSASVTTPEEARALLRRACATEDLSMLVPYLPERWSEVTRAAVAIARGRPGMGLPLGQEYMLAMAERGLMAAGDMEEFPHVLYPWYEEARAEALASGMAALLAGGTEAARYGQGSAGGTDAPLATDAPWAPPPVPPPVLALALRGGEVPDGYETSLRDLLGVTRHALLAELVRQGTATYAQLAALAERLLPEGHDTRTWLDVHLGRGGALPLPGRLAPLLPALPLLRHVFADVRPGAVPDWTLGGGLALAFWLNHRRCRVVDVSVHGAGLAEFTPARNPHAAALGTHWTWSGHVLRFLWPGGGVAFRWAQPLTHPGHRWRMAGGLLLAVETPEEAVVQAVRGRAELFGPADAFDLAAAGAARPGLAQVLAYEVPDLLPKLIRRVRALEERRGVDGLREEVVPVGKGAALLPEAYGRALRVIARAAELAGVALPAPKPARRGTVPGEPRPAGDLMSGVADPGSGHVPVAPDAAAAGRRNHPAVREGDWPGARWDRRSAGYAPDGNALRRPSRTGRPGPEE